MPGSPTTPGRADTRVDASVHVAFRENEHVGTRVAQVFAAQWLAYVLPCRRFAATLTGDSARLGVGADRYSFTVVDLHLLLLAGFTGAPNFLNSATACGLSVAVPFRRWQTASMWKLRRRDDRQGRQWSELGTVDSISAGAARILELEGERNGALFFRVYVDVWDEKGSDAKNAIAARISGSACVLSAHARGVIILLTFATAIISSTSLDLGLGLVAVIAHPFNPVGRPDRRDDNQARLPCRYRLFEARGAALAFPSIESAVPRLFCVVAHWSGTRSRVHSSSAER